MYNLGLDCETTWLDNQNVPFIATSFDDDRKARLYDMKKSSDRKVLKKKCRDVKVRKAFHNAPFDITALRTWGIKVLPPFDDTMIMANLLNENYESKALKGLAKIYLNEPCLEDKELSKVRSKLKREAKKKGINFTYDMIPPKVLFPYAKKDPQYTLDLKNLFWKKIKKYWDIYQFELDLVPIVSDMIFNGIRIDRKFVKKMLKQYETEQNKVYGKLVQIIEKIGVKFRTEKKYKRYPKKDSKWSKIYEQEDGTFLAIKYDAFNPKADAHVRKVLAKLEVPIRAVTDKKQEMAVDADTLKEFKHVPFVERLLRYRFLQKQIGTYYEPLLNYYTTPKNDRAHFALYLSAAKSSRFTAELVQTIPRKDEDKEEENIRVVRNAFIPDDGYYFATIDYDQIEMRLFAHYSGCKNLIYDFLHKIDPYLGAARRIFEEVSEWELELGKEKDTKKIAKLKAKIKGKRRKAKNISLGVIYGMGQQKMADQLDLPLMEGKEVLDTYYSLYPEVREHMHEITNQLYKTGIVTLVFDSPLMHFHRAYRVPQDYAYKSVNIRIQGTAAYVMKAGMKRCFDYIKENNLDIRLLLTIHDELIFEINKKYKKEDIVPKLTALMEDRVTFKVPILASPKVSDKSWGDCKDFKVAA